MVRQVFGRVAGCQQQTAAPEKFIDLFLLERTSEQSLIRGFYPVRKYENIQMVQHAAVDLKVVDEDDIGPVCQG